MEKIGAINYWKEIPRIGEPASPFWADSSECPSIITLNTHTHTKPHFGVSEDKLVLLSCTEKNIKTLAEISYSSGFQNANNIKSLLL